MTQNDDILQIIREYESSCADIINAMQLGCDLIQKETDENELLDLMRKYEQLRRELKQLRAKTEASINRIRDK